MIMFATHRKKKKIKRGGFYAFNSISTLTLNRWNLSPSFISMPGKSSHLLHFCVCCRQTFRSRATEIGQPRVLLCRPLFRGALFAFHFWAGLLCFSQPADPVIRKASLLYTSVYRTPAKGIKSCQEKQYISMFVSNTSATTKDDLDVVSPALHPTFRLTLPACYGTEREVDFSCCWAERKTGMTTWQWQPCSM